MESETIIECTRCGGDGNMKTLVKPGGRRYTNCEVCGGRGKIKLSKTPPFFECGHCDGSGEVGKGTRKGGTGDVSTCSICDGTGVSSEQDLESY